MKKLVFYTLLLAGMVWLSIGSSLEAQNATLWSGSVSFPLKITSLAADSKGNEKFANSADSFSGTIEFITAADGFVANQEGCFVAFLGDDNISICIKEMASLATLTTSKTDKLLLIGTGEFSRTSGGATRTGPVYLDAKGSIKKDNAGAENQISLSGKIAGGTDLEFIFSGSLSSTLNIAGEAVVVTTNLEGSQEVPSVATSGAATAVLLVNLDTGGIRAKVTFSGLTSNAAAAHIHQGAPEVNGPVIVPLEGGEGGTSGVWRTSSGATFTADQLTAFQAGNLYFNIHTTNNPGGEIRGQIMPSTVAIPSPPTPPPPPASPSDTTPPTVTIMSPTGNGTFSLSASPLSIGGSASDNVGVTEVTWLNDRGGSGTATGTTSWSASGIILLNGQNVITVTARDGAGNTGTATLTVEFTPSPPAPTPPAPPSPPPFFPY